MRRKVIEADLIECVLGLGPNLFYNSPMEACVVICRAAKPKSRRGKILLINAVNEVTRERAQSFLTDDHIQRIVHAYTQFEDEPGFARVASLEEIRAKDGNLSIPLYVAPAASGGSAVGEEPETSLTDGLPQALAAWLTSRRSVVASLRAILPDLPTPDLGETLNGLEGCALFKRSRWERVRFGDVVENLNETCDPADAGIERFIGLDHLEPGSLHISTWGNVADGTTFTRRCRAGQVLFGKRRAYQRKVAVAEFDAVVSGDIYVLAPKNERLMPALLPFICLSERFYRFAVETSAGSLSPRTNWSHLATFEFTLPPLDQQRRIAEVLWTADECANRLGSVCDTFISWVESVTMEQFSAIKASGTPFVPLTEVCLRQPQSGIYKGPDQVGKGTRTVRMGELFGNDLIDHRIEMLRMDLSAKEIDNYALTADDLLFGRRSIVLEGAGKCSMVGRLTEPTAFESSILRVTIDPQKALSGFLFDWFHSPEGERAIGQIRSFTTIAGITGSALRRVKVPLPPIDVQRGIRDGLLEYRNHVAVLTHARSQIQRLQKALIEALVGGKS